MRIQIRDNDMPPYEVELESFGKDVVSFGKQPDNDIVLKSAYASRIHGCFYKENGVTYIEDMNSTNGLKIHGNKIKKMQMKVGESVEINVGNYGNGVVFTCVAESHGGMPAAPPMPAYNYRQQQPVYNGNYYQQQNMPYNGNYYQNGYQRKYQKRFNIGNDLFWFACFITGISVFFDYISVEVFDYKETFTLMKNGEGDGIFFLMLVFMGLIFNATKLNTGNLVVSIISVFFLVLELSATNDAMVMYDEIYNELITYEIGYWLLILGVLYMVVTSAMSLSIHIKEKNEFQ